MALQLPEQEEQEEQEALQESPDGVLEEALQRALLGDIQEEFCPLLSDSQEEHAEGGAKELPQHDEPGEEESPRDRTVPAVEGAVEEPLVSCSQEEAEPPQGEEHKEHLEVTVKEVASVYSHDSDGQAAGGPQSPQPGSPESFFPTDSKELLQQDRHSLMDPEKLHPDAGAPSGYYPCYHTYAHLPSCQLQDGDEAPRPSGRTFSGIRVGGSSPDQARGREGGAEADPGREGSQGKPHPDKWPLPPSLEEASRRSRKGQAVVKRREQPAPAPSCLPAPSDSQRSVNNLLQWVRNIFSWPSLARQPPSPTPAEERGRRHLGSRLRGWLRKHRGRVHPQSR